MRKLALVVALTVVAVWLLPVLFCKRVVSIISGCELNGINKLEFNSSG